MRYASAALLPPCHNIAAVARHSRYYASIERYAMPVFDAATPRQPPRRHYHVTPQMSGQKVITSLPTDDGYSGAVAATRQPDAAVITTTLRHASDSRHAIIATRQPSV